MFDPLGIADDADFPHKDKRVVFGLRVGDVKIERMCRVRHIPAESPQEWVDAIVKELRREIAEAIPSLVSGLRKKLKEASK